MRDGLYQLDREFQSPFFTSQLLFSLFFTTTTDYSIDANGEEYAAALPFVLVMIVIYPVGIPGE